MFDREIQTKLPEIDLESSNCKSKDNVHLKYKTYQARMKKYHDRKWHASEHKFKVGDKVFIVNRAQGKLESKFSDIPYAIKERVGKDSFKVVNISNGKVYVCNQKHLKHISENRENKYKINYRGSTYVEFDIDNSVNDSELVPEENSSSDVVSKGKIIKKIIKNIPSLENEQKEQNDKQVTTRSGRTVKPK
jgi:hypothetical protein